MSIVLVMAPWEVLKDPQEDLDHFAHWCCRMFSLHFQKSFPHAFSVGWKLCLWHILLLPCWHLPYLLGAKNNVCTEGEKLDLPYLEGYFKYIVPITKGKTTWKERMVESEM